MNEQQAKIVALRALAYLVRDEDVLQRFMDLSGSDAMDIRQRADDPAGLKADGADALHRHSLSRLEARYCSITASNSVP